VNDVIEKTTQSTTRRGAIARLALLVGGAVGAGVAGKAAVDRGDTSEVTPLVTRQTIVLHGRDWRLARPGVAPGAMPAADAVAVPTGTILDETSRELGTFRASALPGLGSAFALHTFDLVDGTILGIGAGRLDADYAIVGGTGRYAGATGTYSAQQSPRESGGDGTARFTLDIKALEA
jgi:hypothetical protein